MSDVHSPPTATERFEAFLKAADRVALEMLLTEGISPFKPRHEFLASSARDERKRTTRLCWELHALEEVLETRTMLPGRPRPCRPGRSGR